MVLLLLLVLLVLLGAKSCPSLDNLRNGTAPGIASSAAGLLTAEVSIVIVGLKREVQLARRGYIDTSNHKANLRSLAAKSVCSARGLLLVARHDGGSRLHSPRDSAEGRELGVLWWLC